MLKNSNEIVVVGTIPNKQELLKFTSAFAKSTLFKHQERTALINQNGLAFHVTLYLTIHSEKLIDSAFTQGALRHWKDQFAFKMEVSP
jgi:hypothetical protein